jgi:hypothetical protein
MTKMNDLDFVIAYMLESAAQLDDSGKIVTASHIDEHVQRIVTAGYGGGISEYIGKLLELARNKGIDYMQSRMQEERIVTLNDGTPVLKQNDEPWLVKAVVARARSLKLPETKGLKPTAPGQKDSKWSGESAKRLEEIKSGKSSWLAQAKPFSDAIEEKKRKKLKWEPPVSKKQVGKPNPATTPNKTEPKNPPAATESPKSNSNSNTLPKPPSTTTSPYDAKDYV